MSKPNNNGIIVPVKVHGHVKIVDDLGKVLLDQDNAIHPQNMARVISRALANEPNYYISSIAFGTGGTTVDAALNVTFNSPNDGQAPDTRTWDSTLYNETYREVVDEEDSDFGTGPGSGGTDTATGLGVSSSELGVLSQVTVKAYLNTDEPSGQLLDSTDPENQNIDGTFTFDEIGLFTGGLPLSATAGYHNVEVGSVATVNSDTDSDLNPSTVYDFFINVDSVGAQQITFTTPASGSGTLGAITFGDICEAINTGDVAWNALWAGVSPLPGGATVTITDINGNYPTLVGVQTNGYMKFTSGTTGALSSCEVSVGTTNDMFADFNDPIGADPASITPVSGNAAGDQNNADGGLEAERMLTHIIFSPVTKTADRALTIIYTLTIAVARSE